MRALISELERLPGFAAVQQRLEQDSVQRITGLVGGARGALAAQLFGRLRRTILVVTPSTRRAEAWFDDLHALVRTETDDLAPPLRLFPSLPTLLYSDVTADRELIGQRLDTMEALLRGEPIVVVASLSALLHRTIPPRSLAGTDLDLAVGQDLQPEALIQHLGELGYVEHDPVIMPGQCVQRGGIVDLYPVTAPQPIRIEFWGDEIESIRYFDVNSQRSTLPQERFTVTVSRESLWNQALGAQASNQIAQAVEQHAGQLESAGRTMQAKRLRARVTADLEKLEHEVAFPTSDHYLPFLYQEVTTLFDYLPNNALVVVDSPEAPSPVATTERRVASWILASRSRTWTVARLDCSLSALISLATTENPRPCSPARAASMAAFRPRRFVCSAMSSTEPVSSAIACACSARSAIVSATDSAFARAASTVASVEVIDSAPARASSSTSSEDSATCRARCAFCSEVCATWVTVA
ncbi:MAG: hypothetical protein HUU35_06860, partial [Armatimonadetes bacterium]|nr:hypothetical protein [Armatimonadota bacterium]